MKTRNKSRTLFVLFGVLFATVIDFGLPFVQNAQAIIGRPLTPMSYAGVARRTTRRAYYAGAAGGYGYGAPAPYYAPAPYPYAPAPYPYW